MFNTTHIYIVVIAVIALLWSCKALRYQRTPKGTILAKNIFFHFRINLSITFHLKKILRIKLDSLQSYRRKLVFALIII